MELILDGRLYFLYISWEINCLQYILMLEFFREFVELGFEVIYKDDVQQLRVVIVNVVNGDLSELNIEYWVKLEQFGQYWWNRLWVCFEFKVDGGLVWYGIFEDVIEQKLVVVVYQNLFCIVIN